MGGREGAVGSLSVLGHSRSFVTATARVPGTASRTSAAKLQAAYARSAAFRHVVQLHTRALRTHAHLRWRALQAKS